MFSIDDSQEYKADFVLATLLDSDAPAHCPTSSLSNGSSIQAAEKRRNSYHDDEEPSKTSKIMHDEFSRTDPDDNGRRNTALQDTRVPQGDLKQSAAGGRRTNGHGVHREQGSTSSLLGPSGSSNAKQHVPPPPSDIDFMDVDSALFAPPPPRSRVSGRRAPPREDTASELDGDYNPVDALFEAENKSDVADDGNMFGHGVHGDPHMGGATRAGVGGKGKGKRQGQDTKRTVSLRDSRPGERTVDPTGGDGFFDDFPYQGR